MFISEINQRDGWVFGTNGIVQETTSPETETPPQVLLFFAQQQLNGWNVAIEHSPDFANSLHNCPKVYLRLINPQRCVLQQDKHVVMDR